VYPSGAERATAVSPTVPPAPVMFSTITCWPSSGVISRAIARATTSLVPPAAKGDTSLIVLPG
jgi:hypothetical protein